MSEPRLVDIYMRHAGDWNNNGGAMGQRVLDLIDKLGITLPKAERDRIATAKSDDQMQRILRLRLGFVDTGERLDPGIAECEFLSSVIVAEALTNLRACDRAVRAAEEEMARTTPTRQLGALRVMIYAIHKKGMLLRDAIDLLITMSGERRKSDSMRQSKEPKKAPSPEPRKFKSKPPDSLAFQDEVKPNAT